MNDELKKFELARFEREAEAALKGTGFWRYGADATAETDSGTDAIMEAPDRVKALEAHFAARGLDPHDVWSAIRGVRGGELAHQYAVELGISPELMAQPEMAETLQRMGFSAHVDFGRQAFAAAVPAESVFDSLSRHGADLRGVARRPDGLMAQDHGLAALQLVAGARNDLFASVFQLEQAAVVAGLLDKARDAQDGLIPRIHTFKPITPEGEFAKTAFDTVLRTAKTQSRVIAGMQIADHAKVWLADLDEFETARILIGTANMTQAAVGKIQDRFGRVVLGAPNNLELSRGFHWGMVKDQRIREDVFKQVVEEARQFEDWIHTGGLDPATGAPVQFKPGIGQKQFLLSNEGLRAKVTEHIRNAKSAADTVYIVSDSMAAHTRADSVLGLVLEAVEKGSQARFEIMVGTAHDKTGRKNLAAFQQELIDRGITNVVLKERDGLVHAKATYATIDGKHHEVLGSMRYGERMWYWNAGDDPSLDFVDDMGVRHTQRYRDAGTAMDSDELPELHAAMGAGGIVRRLFGSANTFGANRVKPRFVSAKETLEENRNRFLKAAEEHRANLYRVGETTGGLKVSLGGPMRLGDTTYHLGDLFEFSLLEAKDGPRTEVDGVMRGQYFLPELGKFVGGVVGLSKEGAPTHFDRDAVIAAATDAIQQRITQELEGARRRGGEKAVREMLTNPFERARFQARIKEFAKSRFENFMGVEPGEAAYAAKDHALLAWGTDDAGRLDMSQTLGLTARDVELGTSSFARDADSKAKVRFPQLREFVGHIFMAGGLSRFKKDGQATAARFYDLVKAVRTIAVTGEIEGAEDNALVFLLPASKAAQLPQRFQTLAGARDLSAKYMTGIERDPVTGALGKGLRDYSRLAGADGRVREGIRFRGYMSGSLYGDNAYLVAERFEGEKASTFWETTAKLPGLEMRVGSEHLLEETIANLLDEKHKGQFAERLADGRVLIKNAGLSKLGHVLPVAESLTQMGGTRAHGAGLSTSKWAAADSELILDLETKYYQYDPRSGTRSRYLHGELRRGFQSGDRMMTAAKAPGVFGHESSPIFQAADMLMRGVNPEGYAAFGLEHFNYLSGVDVIKTGDVALQTGFEVLESGYYKTLKQQFQKGSQAASQIKKFLNTFSPYLRTDVKTLLHDMMNGHHADADLMRLLDKTASHLKSGRQTVHAGQVNHMAAGFVAFALMADDQISKLQEVLRGDTERAKRANAEIRQASGGKYENAQQLFREMGLKGRKGEILDYGIDGMRAVDVLSFLQVSFVSNFSASAVAMSSRPRVNFLSYYGDAHSQSLMNLMALSDTHKGRNLAIQELTGTGVLGIGGWNFAEGRANDFYVTAGLDVDVAAFATDGLEREFGELSKLMRDLRTTAMDAGMLSDTQARIQQLSETIATKQKGTLPMIVGNPRSADVQAVIRAQRHAGTQSRILVLPEFGTYTKDGWVESTDGPSVKYRQMTLMSPDALLGAGAFEDFSPDVQVKQIQLEQLVAMLRHHGRKDATQRELYEQMWKTAAELQMAQGATMASALQQYLGGRMAVWGHNMIVGHLPDLKAGVMVLGSEAYKGLKTRATAEILRAMETAAEVRFGKRGEGSALKELLSGPRKDDLRDILDLGDGKSLEKLVDARDVPELRRLVKAGDVRGIQLLIRGNRNAMVATLLFDMVGSLQLSKATQEKLSAILSDEVITMGGSSPEKLDALVEQLEAALVRGGDGTTEGTLHRELQLEHERAGRARATFDAVNESSQVRLERLRKQAGSLRAKADRAMGGMLKKYNLSRAFLHQFVTQETARYEARVDGLESQREGLAIFKEQAETHARAHHQEHKAKLIHVVRSLNARAAHARETEQGASRRAAQLEGRITRYHASREAVERAHSKGVEAELAQVARVAAEQQKLAEISKQAVVDLTMRADALAQRLEATKQSGADLSEVVKLEQQIMEVDRALEGMRTTGTKRLQLRVAQAKKAEALANQARQVEDKIAAEEHISWKRRRKAKAAEKDAEQGVKQVERKITQTQLARVRKTRTLNARRGGGLVGAIEALLDDKVFRSEHMKGLFQRAGAPAGPFGISVQEVWTDQEYSERPGAQLQLAKGFSRMSMWVSTGTMMINLGDYDGDTGSVALLSEYARLKTLTQLGVNLDKLGGEEGERYREALRNLRYSTKEIEIHFARNYLGDGKTYSQEKLYGVKPGQSLAERVEYLHRIRETRERFLKETVGDVDAMPEEDAAKARAEFDYKKAGLEHADVEELKAFEQREHQLWNLAAAGVRFTSEKLEHQKEVAAYVRRKERQGMTREAAITEYYTDSEEGAQAVKAMSKAFKKLGDTVSEATIVADKTVAEGIKVHGERVLQGVMSATAYASTSVIGQAFEMMFASQMGTEAAYQDAFKGIAERARQRLGLAADMRTGKILDFLRTGHGIERQGLTLQDAELDAFRSEMKDELLKVEDARSKDLGGYLMLQQVGRTAIKPAGNMNVLEALMSYVAKVPDGMEAAAGIAFMKTQRAIQGLDTIHQLITGKTLSGDKPGFDFSHQPGAAMDKKLAETTDQFLEFYGARGDWETVDGQRKYKFGDSVENLWAAGMTEDAGEREALLRELAIAHDETGERVMPRSEIDAILQLQESPEVKTDEQIFAEKLAIEERLRQGVEAHVRNLFTKAMDVTERARNQELWTFTEGVMATDDDAYEARQRASGDVSAEGKLRAFMNLAERKKMLSEDGMKWALTEVMEAFETREQLSAALEEQTNVSERSEALLKIYDAYVESDGNWDHARRKTQAAEARVTAEQMQALDATTQHVFEMLGLPQPGAARADTSRTPKMTSRAAQLAVKSGAAHVLNNAVLPGILLGAMMGGVGYGTTGSSTSEDLIQGVAMSAAFLMFGKGTAGLAAASTAGAQDRKEAAVRAGIFSLSMLAGGAAGYAVERFANTRGWDGAGRLVKAGALSSVLGFAAGAILGNIVETTAAAFGWIRPRGMHSAVDMNPSGLSAEGVSAVRESEGELDEAVGITVTKVYDEDGELIAIYEHDGDQNAEDLMDSSVSTQSFDVTYDHVATSGLRGTGEPLTPG